MYSICNLEPVRCSMSGSNCCFLTCIQISQEAEKVVWYSHLFQNFPQFVVIHTAKGFSIVNEAKVGVFWNSLAFSVTQHAFLLRRSVVSNSLRPCGLQPARLLCPWGFSRQEYWSVLPCPPSGDLPNPGIEPWSPTLQTDSLPSKQPGKPVIQQMLAI